MTPDQLDKLVASTSKLYGDIELRILRRIARQVSSDLDVPDWQMRKLAELRLVLRYVGSELDRISPQMLRRVILRAYQDGAATALSELGRVPDETQAYQASAALSRVTPLLDDVDALHGAAPDPARRGDRVAAEPGVRRVRGVGDRQVRVPRQALPGHITKPKHIIVKVTSSKSKTHTYKHI